ncbi:Y-family DNA polymerase [Cognaticolwellia beringensis]|uniref:DNA polymerase V subunit UmuC n=1 Tax=Cognaticolwellia beringensis TaxID=1967665 RepID=A0A222GCI3_9GAMM|nr:Y-family DNA polymerase [Cognaticolwellia beringensis]ASP49501.1 DNA polymerase V subunit UmuC [Cognaticolwellia beringensis]
MYALVDAVSFYASCEKVFDPSIRNKPVVVLTNNDGCICAACPLARRLGVPKFKPYFQIKHFLAKHNVVVRSSNYELYASLSDKMMNVIGRYCDNQYIYSIDESFLQFKNYHTLIKDWHKYGHEIRRAVWQETRLPVGVGFGSTPTLAKAANHAAKKLPGYNGVAVVNDAASRKEVLSKMTVTDVWGIGSRLGKRLNVLGIATAWDLANQSPKAMRSQFSVVVERTVNELNGIVCLNWDEVKQPKKEIFSTRSFGQRVNESHHLKTALVSHGVIVARKLRQQHSRVKKLAIFAASSPHDENYYNKSIMCEFPVATDNTLYIANAISTAFKSIYANGVNFYRCGVGAIELENSEFQQHDLFSLNEDDPKLMLCYDGINHRYGNDTLQLAAQGRIEKWHMRREFLSPSFTSKWRDIPKISC